MVTDRRGGFAVNYEVQDSFISDVISRIYSSDCQTHLNRNEKYETELKIVSNQLITYTHFCYLIIQAPFLSIRRAKSLAVSTA